MLGVAHPGFSSLSDNRKLFGVSVYFSISRFFIFVRSGGQRLICRARVHRAMLIFAFDPPPPLPSRGGTMFLFCCRCIALHGQRLKGEAMRY